MNNYRYEKVNTEFHVIEVKKQQVVFKTTDGKLARQKTHFLNMGGGFDGETPEFFFKKAG